MRIFGFFNSKIILCVFFNVYQFICICIFMYYQFICYCINTIDVLWIKMFSVRSRTVVHWPVKTVKISSDYEVTLHARFPSFRVDGLTPFFTRHNSVETPCTRAFAYGGKPTERTTQNERHGHKSPYRERVDSMQNEICRNLCNGYSQGEKSCWIVTQPKYSKIMNLNFYLKGSLKNFYL